MNTEERLKIEERIIDSVFKFVINNTFCDSIRSIIEINFNIIKINIINININIYIIKIIIIIINNIIM